MSQFTKAVDRGPDVSRFVLHVRMRLHCVNCGKFPSAPDNVARCREMKGRAPDLIHCVNCNLIPSAPDNVGWCVARGYRVYISAQVRIVDNVGQCRERSYRVYTFRHYVYIIKM